MDSFLAAGEQDSVGQGWPSYNWGKRGLHHKLSTVFEPGLSSGQKQPNSVVVRTRNTEGTSTPVARGRPKVQGALVSRCECGSVTVGRAEPQELPPTPVLKAWYHYPTPPTSMPHRQHGEP